MGRDEVILLDTHVIIWLTTGDPALGRKSRALYEQARENNELAVSAISFWELAMLVVKGRLGAANSPAQYRARIIDAGAQELAVTGDIGILAAGLDLHGDPADRFIVATAIAHQAILLTADKTLLRWRNKLPRQNAAK
ncbi:MAG: type II toxin-antitoxin system VapC family toxin [Pseudolabrys sp.]|nr:type II toxin-antitoxin system VapC family toxin [Pseudolabrys sp.]MSP32498.1 type II toxin-antitoxin system VapC family toxin [Pseudolabrys sp.]